MIEESYQISWGAALFMAWLCVIWLVIMLLIIKRRIDDINKKLGNQWDDGWEEHRVEGDDGDAG